MKKLFFLPAVAAMMFLASCGGGETTESTETTTTETPTEEAVEAPGADIPGIADVAVTDHIVLEGSDDMKYDKNLFKIKAGQDTKLTLKNVGTLPVEAMGHNALILVQGADLQGIAEAAIKEKANDYIPAAMDLEIVAHTKLLGPGESDEITFKVPDPGVYEFICTFPGHYSTMRGKIVAE